MNSKLKTFRKLVKTCFPSDLLGHVELGLDMVKMYSSSSEKEIKNALRQLKRKRRGQKRHSKRNRNREQQITQTGCFFSYQSPEQNETSTILELWSISSFSRTRECLFMLQYKPDNVLISWRQRR